MYRARLKVMSHPHTAKQTRDTGLLRCSRNDTGFGIGPVFIKTVRTSNGSIKK